MHKQKEMACEFKLPWMGVLIPSLLLSYIYLTTSYILYYDLTISNQIQVVFQLSTIMLFFSYYLVIVTPAGSPPKTFQIDKSIKPQKMWYKYCVKCCAYKPERTHHCKKCQKCVLKMDHHCPWICNCIGYFNLPHFFRFLFWAVTSDIFAVYIYLLRLIKYYKMRNLPSYLISKAELALTVVTFLCCIFLLFTVGILFIRTLASMSSNETKIEVWEMDRVQEMFFSESFWIKVRANFKLIHPNLKFPELTSWKVNYRVLKKDTKIPLNFTFEDLAFPYDLGSSYENLVDSLGPFYQWLFPWGGPSGDGMHFMVDTLNEDQLNLPFPIDGCNFEPNDMNAKIDENNETVVKSWSNYLGESLNDFGVDLETEEYELIKTE